MEYILLFLLVDSSDKDKRDTGLKVCTEGFVLASIHISSILNVPRIDIVK